MYVLQWETIPVAQEIQTLKKMVPLVGWGSDISTHVDGDGGVPLTHRVPRSLFALGMAEEEGLVERRGDPHPPRQLARKIFGLELDAPRKMGRVG